MRNIFRLLLPVGTRIRCYNNNTTGIVLCVDNAGTVHVLLDKGGIENVELDEMEVVSNGNV